MNNGGDFDFDFDFDFNALNFDFDFDDPLYQNVFDFDDLVSGNSKTSGKDMDMASGVSTGGNGLNNQPSPLPSPTSLHLPLPTPTFEDAPCPPTVNDNTSASLAFNTTAATNRYGPGSLTFQQPTTHAERNPLLPTQEVRPRPAKRTLDPVQARTMNEAKAEKQRHSQLVRSDLMQLMAAFDANVVKLAERHSVKVDYVRELISVSSRLKRQRTAGRMQALIYLKAKEINTMLPVGKKLKAPALRKLVDEDEQLLTITDEKVEEAKREIEEKRLLSTRGLRPNSISGGKDFAYTTELMKKEFDNLHIRTGALGFGFIIPADRHERGIPSWFSAGQDVADFVRKELNSTMWDLLGQFELWGNSKGSARPSTHLELQAHCSTIIVASLRYALKNKSAAMNYTNYRKSIVKKHHIQLIGLPDFESFKDGYSPIPIKPFDIKKRPELEALYAALESGACRWVRMSPEDIKKHGEWLGTQDIPERQEQSDKGTKRGRRKQGAGSDDGEHVNHENAPSTKRQRTSSSGATRGATRGGTRGRRGATTQKARGRVTKTRGRVTKQLPPLPSSREFLTDTDDGDNGNDGDDGNDDDNGSGSGSGGDGDT